MRNSTFVYWLTLSTLRVDTIRGTRYTDLHDFHPEDFSLLFGPWFDDDRRLRLGGLELGYILVEETPSFGPPAAAAR